MAASHTGAAGKDAMLAPVQTDGAIERRQGARQRLTMRVAKLRCLSGEYLCLMHDVSETGARLRMFHAHPPDSHMFLELADGALHAIERRWIDGDFAGCLFSSPVDIAEFLGEHGPQPRRPLRLRIAHPVRYAAGGEPGHAFMVDLSAQGACIEAGRRLAVGALLRLEIPRIAPRFAHVAWRRTYRHGLAFQQALPLADLARLALELQPFAGEAVEAVYPAGHAIRA
jgi:hypothetical protein